MDPLSQAVLGASAPQSFARKGELTYAAVLGFLAGMSPDLDVLIQSPTDPLLFLEYHRQFTHSLIFIPIGGLICALVLHLAFARRWLPFHRVYLYCTLGYATHALLDACTTYGTQLFWPFSDIRVAWNTISIVDPLFTFPILILIVIGARRKNSWWARTALIWAITYPAIGVIQRDRATLVGAEIASARGHNPLRLEAKPSFANLLVWKIVYETQDRFYVDAVRVGLGEPIHFSGNSAIKVDVSRDFPWLDGDSQQAIDIKRFRWFSNDYLALDPVIKNKIIDVRYSMVPNDTEALWGITINPRAEPDVHVGWATNRDPSGDRVPALLRMIFP